MIPFLSIIALGFLLGMRHATDADHVIAVTTIVSRERSVARAAAIGMLWGIGHTVTIIAVGALNLRGLGRGVARLRGAHVHPHAHGDFVHSHTHGHDGTHHGHDVDA